MRNAPPATAPNGLTMAETVFSLNDTVSTLTGTVSTLKDKVSRHKERLSRQEDTLSFQRAELSHLKDVVSHHDTVISRQDTVISRQETVVSRLATELSELNLAFRALQSKMTDPNQAVPSNSKEQELSENRLDGLIEAIKTLSRPRTQWSVFPKGRDLFQQSIFSGPRNAVLEDDVLEYLEKHLPTLFKEKKWFQETLDKAVAAKKVFREEEYTHEIWRDQTHWVLRLPSDN